ncbi:MAG: thiamine phosphate synthase, partial [Candidatus Omnitrophica bacterium]|nr:thiamine phosphate synthase [Candidatus Omnitrophota bacterium]
MPRGFDLEEIYRIIDADINRAKEGLRVCEEVVRFILNSPSLTLEFKKIRHGLDNTIEKLFPSKTNLILKRQANKDVGKVISEFEFRRKNILD